MQASKEQPIELESLFGEGGVVCGHSQNVCVMDLSFICHLSFMYFIEYAMATGDAHACNGHWFWLCGFGDRRVLV